MNNDFEPIVGHSFRAAAEDDHHLDAQAERNGAQICIKHSGFQPQDEAGHLGMGARWPRHTG